MILDFLKWNEKPFPEKGVYKGVQYRIDGDSVILRCSNGREIEMFPAFPAGIYDEVRQAVLDPQIKYDSSELTHWAEPPNPDKLVGSGPNEGRPVSLPPEEVAAAYGIHVLEYAHLVNRGDEIMLKYWQSRKSR